MQRPFEKALSRRDVLQAAVGGIAATSLLGGLAAACGGGSGTEAASTTSSDATASGAGATTSGSATPTTITCWNEHPEYKQTIDQLLELFHGSHPEITVDMTYQPAAEYGNLLNTALVAGTAPDVIGFIGAGALRDVGVKDGYLAPMDGTIAPADLTPIALESVDYEGHIWGVPFHAYAAGVFYHRPIFEDLGLSRPKSWDELSALCDTLKQNDITPMSMPGKDMIIPYFFYIMAVSSVIGPEGLAELQDGTRKLTDPDLVEAVQLMIDLGEKGYYNPGFQALGYAESKALFGQGQAAMLMGGTGDYVEYLRADPEIELGVFGFPPPTTGEQQIGITGMEILYTLNKASEHPEAVATFLDWIVSEEAQQFVVDELGQRSVIADVAPSPGSRFAAIDAEFTAASDPEVPVWIDVPALANVLGAVVASSGVFTGSVDAAQFAAAAQETIVPASG